MAGDGNTTVNSIIENIRKSQQSCKNGVVTEKKTSIKENTNVVRGMPKSGRFWKSNKERFSSINKTKGLRQDFKKKTALRLELKRTKELSKQAQEQIKQREVDRKERRRLNIKKTEENRRKAEVVQVITNSAKLKRMKKKQLRFVQKQDTNSAIEANK
ncbi:hypothetical protein ACJJTC_006072 [Scirpophaga incertulas]